MIAKPRRSETFREAVASAISQPVASIVAIIVVAAMCAAVLLTTGRTVGAEQSVVSSIDNAGTRSIVVRAEAGAGLDSTVVDRLAHLEGIEWSAAFGTAVDAQNSAFPGGTRVPLRSIWGADLTRLGISQTEEPERSAWASTSALEALGLEEVAGGVETAEGIDFGLVGRVDVPDYLRGLEPLLVSPQSSRDAPGEVAVLIVVASRPDLVATVAEAVGSILAVDDPSKISIRTSEDLAALRALVQTQLGTFSRSLVLGLFGLTALLVAAILYGLVVLRRKDFGRRRALGASQRLIMTMLLMQVAVLAAVGATLGNSTALIVLVLGRDPLPSASFVVALGALSIAVAVAAAVVPAIAAARREPIAELRVP